MRRHGTGLVELLIVLGLLFILLMLLLPAILQSREASRRVACLNNLAQMRVALHCYEEKHRVYPPGTIDYQSPILSNRDGYHYGWIVQLLPHLEQNMLTVGVDYTKSIYENSITVPVSVLECPADRKSPFPRGTNYGGNHNDQESPISVSDNGVFFLNSSVSPVDISDGLSNTIFIGEILRHQDSLGWSSGTRSSLRNGGSAINAPLPKMMSQPDDDEAIVKLKERYVGGFSSAHVGGAYMLFGDGSIRFLTDDIDLDLLRRLTNRHDGELIQRLPGSHVK